MKKKIALILPLIAVLASCGSTQSSSSVLSSSSSSTTTSTSSSSVSTSTSGVEPAKVLETADDIIGYLLKAADGNYTFTGNITDEIQYENVVTENYYYSSMYHPYYGAVLLPNFDKTSEDKEILYSYEIYDGEISIGSPVTQGATGGYATSINDNYNPLSMLKSSDYSFTGSLLTENGDGSFDLAYDSADAAKVTLLGLLGYTLGYDAGILSSIDGATLYGLDDGSLEIQFNLKEGAENETGLTANDLYGVISDVGTSSMESLEDVLSSKPLSGPALPDSATDVLKRTEGSITTDVQVVVLDSLTGEKNVSSLGEYRIDFDANHYFTKMTQGDLSTYDNYYRYDSTAEGVREGDAYSRKINGANELTFVDALEGFDSLMGDHGVSQLPGIQAWTAQNADGDYVYYGQDADNYLIHLTGLSMSAVQYLTFQVEDGKVDGITAHYGESTVQGYTVYFELTVTFGEVGTFIDPVAFTSEANPGDSERLQTAFDHFNETSPLYFVAYDAEDKAADPENYDRTEYFLSSDMVFTIDHTQGAVLYKGVLDNGDGTITHFEVTNDNGKYSARETSSATAGSLSDYRFTVDPIVLQLDGDTATLRPNVLEIGDYIPEDLKSPYMDPTTFEMKLDSDDNIESYSYYYDIGDMGLVYGTRTTEVGYGADATIPSDIQTAIDNRQKWGEPTSWSACKSVYNSMTAVFGVETADKIPYLYYEGVTDENSKVLTGEGRSAPDMADSYVFAYGMDQKILDFIDAYVQMLEDNGFTKEETVDEEGNTITRYVSDDFIIVPSISDGFYGLYFYLNV